MHLIITLALLAPCDADSDARAALALASARPPQCTLPDDAKPHLPPAGNCKCGCEDTGKCMCKDCDHPKGPSPCPPTPNCQCGCTVTGACTCHDCNHPALTKPAAKDKDTHAADQAPGPGYVRTLGDDGVWGPWTKCGPAAMGGPPPSLMPATFAAPPARFFSAPMLGGASCGPRG